MHNEEKPDIEIVQMDIDDIPYVYHMGELLFTAEKHNTLYRTWDKYEVTHFFHNEPDLSFVAKNETEEVVGFVMGTRIIKPQSAWSYGHLVWLGVLPDYQRFGVAHKLVDTFSGQLKKEGIRIMLVDTEKSNKRAIAFFKKYGFGNTADHVYLSLNLETQDK